MKTIIAGSRGINDYEMLVRVIKASGFEITEVVSGHCNNSPDMLGEQWAQDNKVPVRLCPAKWAELGRPAGVLRNIEMSKYADQAIVIWDGKSVFCHEHLKDVRPIGEGVKAR